MTPKKYISPPPTRPYFFLVISDTHTCHNQLKLASFQFFSRLSKNRAKFGILLSRLQSLNAQFMISWMEIGGTFHGSSGTRTSDYLHRPFIRKETCTIYLGLHSNKRNKKKKKKKTVKMNFLIYVYMARIFGILQYVS